LDIRKRRKQDVANNMRSFIICIPSIRVNKSRKMRWAGYIAFMSTRNAYKILVGKLEGNRSLGRHTH
jgi:hypothetical protein